VPRIAVFDPYPFCRARFLAALFPIPNIGICAFLLGCCRCALPLALG
jgi:hypothetical protein